MTMLDNAILVALETDRDLRVSRVLSRAWHACAAHWRARAMSAERSLSELRGRTCETCRYAGDAGRDVYCEAPAPARMRGHYVGQPWCCEDWTEPT